MVELARKLGISPYRAVLAQQFSIYGFTELSPLRELAWQKHLPIKQLRAFAGLKSEQKQFDAYSLQSLNITPEELVRFENEFNAKRLKFGLSWQHRKTWTASTICSTIPSSFGR